MILKGLSSSTGCPITRSWSREREEILMHSDQGRKTRQWCMKYQYIFNIAAQLILSFRDQRLSMLRLVRRATRFGKTLQLVRLRFRLSIVLVNDRGTTGSF